MRDKPSARASSLFLFSLVMGRETRLSEEGTLISQALTKFLRYGMRHHRRISRPDGLVWLDIVLDLIPLRPLPTVEDVVRVVETSIGRNGHRMQISRVNGVWWIRARDKQDYHIEPALLEGSIWNCLLRTPPINPVTYHTHTRRKMDWQQAHPRARQVALRPTVIRRPILMPVLRLARWRLAHY